eukprot:10269269-Prorocentrum_lima.AAC.1
MTSSLVGSEMCIRDSTFYDRATGWIECIGVKDKTAESVHNALSTLRRPVSYTHLTLPTICSV